MTSFRRDYEIDDTAEFDIKLSARYNVEVPLVLGLVLYEHLMKDASTLWDCDLHHCNAHRWGVRYKLL